MRHSNWPSLMFAAIDEARERPFVWGESDCCLFAADVVLAMTGEDYAAPYRGKYNSARGSLIALKKYGAGTIEGSLDLIFPRRRCPRRGDVVIVTLDDSPALGICVGAQSAFRTKEGIVLLSSQGLIGWEVN